jgi:hypothetical protein
MSKDLVGGGKYVMLSYVRQAALCNSVRETIREAFSQDDLATKLKMGNIPSVDTILRTVSLFPHVNDEHTLKPMIIDHILRSLRLSEDHEKDLRSRIELSVPRSSEQHSGDFPSSPTP